MTKQVSQLYIPVIKTAEEIAIHSLSHYGNRDVVFSSTKEMIETYAQASMASAIAAHSLVAHHLPFTQAEAGWPSVIRGWGQINLDEHLKNTAGLALLALNELRSIK